MSPAPTPPDPRSIEGIVLRTTNWLGDVVLASPALRALREHFPRARLAVVVRDFLAPFFSDHPHVDEVIVDPRGPGDLSPLLPWRLGRRLARGRFQVAVILSRSFESALTIRLSGIPIRTGLDSHRRGRLLTHPVPETWARRFDRHHAEVHLDVVRCLGAEGEAREPVVPLPASGQDEAVSALLAAGVGDDEALLVVHPGASRDERTWAPERFGRVAAHLAGEYGLRPLILGTRVEATTCTRTAETAGPHAVDLGGRLGLRALAAVQHRATLVLANDSGPMHLASAVGTPVVGIFGPGDPGKTAPLPGSTPSAALTLGFPCAPCRQRFFRDCRPSASGRPLCLEELAEERVLAAARHLLATPPARGA